MLFKLSFLMHLILPTPSHSELANPSRRSLRSVDAIFSFEHPDNIQRTSPKMQATVPELKLSPFPTRKEPAIRSSQRKAKIKAKTKSRMPARQNDKLDRSIAKEFECAGRAAGAKTAKQLYRVKYFGKILNQFFSRLHPKPSSTWRKHLAAQMLAETGNLRHLTERRSRYASSRKKHKGRGGIQITHRSNYARFAGFYRAYERSGEKLNRRKLISAPALNNSFEVRNPAAAFSEKTKEGRERNVLAGVWYFMYTSTRDRSRRMTRFLEEDTLNAASRIGAAVNKGVGRIMSTPLNNSHRRRVFRKIARCYK